MKKTITVLTLLAGAVSVYSQGSVVFNDYGNPNFTISVYAPSTLTPGIEASGNTGIDNPSGNQTYTGVLIGGSTTGTGPYDYKNGNNFSIQLYANAGTGDAASTLVAVPGAVATFFTGEGLDGYFNINEVVNIPGTAAGGTATLQLKAWDNDGGTVTSYEAAVADGLPAGYSTLGNVNLGSVTIQPPDMPGGANGIQSFSLTTVPEPSTIALGIMGVSAFLIRRRK